jgi:hypothetical protein
MPDCLSTESYRALLGGSTPLRAADAYGLFGQDLCSQNITIKCDGVTSDSLLAIAQCERDIALGIDVLAPCAAIAHPQVLAALAAQCPEKGARLDSYREQLRSAPTKSSLSPGGKWALVAMGCVGVAVLGYAVYRD